MGDGSFEERRFVFTNKYKHYDNLQSQIYSGASELMFSMLTVKEIGRTGRTYESVYVLLLTVWVCKVRFNK